MFLYYTSFLHYVFKELYIFGNKIMDNNKEGTLLQRGKKSVKINKETLLILRAYVNHPTSWQEIMEEVKQTLDVFLPSAREVYSSGSLRQLRDRMSGKLSSLIKKRLEDITDADVRSAVEDIRRLQRRLIPEPEPAQEPEALHQEEQVEEAEPARPQPDVRVEMAATVSTDASDEEQHRRRQTPERRRRQRKRPLAELIRENQEAYNRFVTKKVPKLMRIFGVSSSSDEN